MVRHDGGMSADSGKHAGNRDDDDGLAHGFDQTNDFVEGLQGDADNPEKVNDRLDGEQEVPPIVATPPTGGTPQGVVPPLRAHLPNDDEKNEKNTDPDA